MLKKSRNISRFVRMFSSGVFEVSPEVRSALDKKKPIVALESTIITHGMPHPQNLKTTLDVQNIIRAQGAVPALMAIMKGKIMVGLEDKQIAELADPQSKAIKTSRRDFPYVISNKLNGGLTVSGTLLVAGSVGIDVFVTGGIGGVHRNGESTLDISADLVELGKHSIMVVSSGVKSILDIERTLEYLETEGVCVVTYGPSKKFPAFYSEESGHLSPYHVTDPAQAASLLHSCKITQMNSGILLAVPVPMQFSIDLHKMEANIDLALDEAEKIGIIGKDVTPFVLDKVSQITHGKSLETNIALIKNNALIGAKVAVEYNNLIKKNRDKIPTVKEETKKPVVIGGSNLDCTVTLADDAKIDGRTNRGKIIQTPGGVGRNIADCLGKISDRRTLFISALGKDQFGDFLLNSVSHVDVSKIEVIDEKRTACYTVLIDKKGEAKFGVGDMEIHSEINVNKKDLENSSILIVDANINENVLNRVIQYGSELNIPVWFEPTDVSKSSKPFKTDLWKKLSCISPNMNELKTMAKSAGLNFDEEFEREDVQKLLKQLVYLATPLAEHIPLIMVTMGKFGALMVTKNCENPLKLERTDQKSVARYYPAIPIDKIANCLGAGDSGAAGFIDGMIRGLTEPECISLGHSASLDALLSETAVPQNFNHDRTSPKFAQFIEIPFQCV